MAYVDVEPTEKPIKDDYGYGRIGFETDDVAFDFDKDDTVFGGFGDNTEDYFGGANEYNMFAEKPKKQSVRPIPLGEGEQTQEQGYFGSSNKGMFHTEETGIEPAPTPPTNPARYTNPNARKYL